MFRTFRCNIAITRTARGVLDYPFEAAISEAQSCHEPGPTWVDVEPAAALDEPRRSDPLHDGTAGLDGTVRGSTNGAPQIQFSLVMRDVSGVHERPEETHCSLAPAVAR